MAQPHPPSCAEPNSPPLETELLPPSPARLAALLLSPLLWVAAYAQEHPQPDPPVASTNSTENSEVPQVPGLSGLLRGLNAGLTISGVHDGASGWATFAQPAIGYSFNDTFAFDITVPIFMYRLAETRVANPKPTALLVKQRAEVGDVIFALHAQFRPAHLDYEATASGTAPTGDQLYGLSTGRATFDLNNHFAHDFTWISPSIELGVGDSSTLVNQLVLKDYTSLGPLAHFQIGAAFPLPLAASFETSVYEQLPIGDQKIYQTVKRGKTTTLVVAGRSVTEDNGFINSLDIPLDRHTTLSAYYSRSLRLHDDVVSIGLTYVLRGSKKSEPSDDDLIRNLQELTPAPPPAPAPLQ